MIKNVRHTHRLTSPGGRRAHGDDADVLPPVVPGDGDPAVVQPPHSGRVQLPARRQEHRIGLFVGVYGVSTARSICVTGFTISPCPSQDHHTSYIVIHRHGGRVTQPP